MSPKCVTACLGLGNSRVARVCSGHQDRRYRIWGGVHRFNSDCITFVLLFQVVQNARNILRTCLFGALAS